MTRLFPRPRRRALRGSPTLVVALTVAALALAPAPFENRQQGGGDGVGSHAEHGVSRRTLDPVDTFHLRGDYRAAGVGLRGASSGMIRVRGVPPSASVERAFLYWSFLDDGRVSGEETVTFTGRRVVGTEVGRGPDTCWGRSASRAFRADVTSFVRGDGDYTISGLATGGSLLAQGASLIVLFRDQGEAQRTIVLVDGNDVVRIDDGNTGPPTILRQSTVLRGFRAADSGRGVEARTTFIVGDGQDFEEQVAFRAGAGTATLDNSLDGSDGDLWDTDTYDVSDHVAVGDTSATVEIRIDGAASWDCLNWVAQVLSVSATRGLDVPLFKQDAAEWANDEYDSANSQRLFCGTTMARCGCYTTSMAMLLMHYGVTRGPDGRSTSPKVLDDYLTQNNGYIYGALKPDGVERYSKLANERFGTPIVEYAGRTESHDPGLIASDLDAGRPVILREQLPTGTHFIVATGRSGNTFTINDPFFDRQLLTDYGNTSTGLRRYRTTQTDLSSLIVAAPAPVQFVVTDRDGNRTGTDPQTGSSLTEISGSEYALEPVIGDPTGSSGPPPTGAGVHIAYIPDPTAGTYVVEVIADPATAYSVTVIADDRDGTSVTEVLEGVVPDSRPTFDFSYSPEPEESTLVLELPPRAIGANATTAEDTAVEVSLSGVDPNEDPLSFSIVALPEHGRLGPISPVSDTTATVTYTPTPNRSGADSFAFEVSDGRRRSAAATVSIAVVPEPHTLGAVEVTSGRWHLRNESGQVTSFFFGNPGDLPFVGDWDCDGDATPGLFRVSDAFAYLSNENRSKVADIRFFFGDPEDVPLAGDFDGDGCDTVSIYRPSEQRFYVMNELGENDGGLGAADFSFGFGNPNDNPVVGDWDGDGIDEVGLHRESTGFFYWRDTLTTGAAHGEIFFGDPADRFVAGDWGRVDGRDTPGVFRPSDATFYLRHSLTQGIADDQVDFGEAGWLPVAGDFGLG